MSELQSGNQNPPEAAPRGNEPPASEGSPESTSKSEATSETSILRSNTRGKRHSGCRVSIQEERVLSPSGTAVPLALASNGKHPVRKSSSITSIRRHRAPSVLAGPELETIVTEYSTNGSYAGAHLAHRMNQCRPLAILLRFRVAQIASGSCTFLLGCVALLDTATRGSLSFALLAGALGVVTASLHTSDCRRRGISGLEYICPGLHVTVFVILTVIMNFALIVLDSLCIFGATDKNSFKLGIAQAIVCLPWNCLEFITLALRVMWARRVLR
ncbi:uncharacterized protein LOC114828491 [Galendromus occidentalis]|uniref:Uncharacterized protein LOC114828491 n=1 Tax=Galendromus occidentalis TaxID=34638 RepID=A0AAJ7SIS6_9ACAR|nr:uncharacterized protein LOC114828491 [Galendromus occidentalis]